MKVKQRTKKFKLYKQDWGGGKISTNEIRGKWDKRVMKLEDRGIQFRNKQINGKYMSQNA